MKTINYTTEILWDFRKGIYLQTIYYTDGSTEERKVPKGQLCLPNDLLQYEEERRTCEKENKDCEES